VFKQHRITEVPGCHCSRISQNSNVALAGEAMKQAIDPAEYPLPQPVK
jgi:hypothetical protein